ncbi:hypothetical protein AAVH_07851 [Aphelenchoides avenae]|nr:hypothetical protein AAVH_07851 [Aphelenchus avenae]
MIPELRYELLFFYTRDDLERLQPLSQSLLDMIVAGSNVLALRPIYRVDMDRTGHEREGKIRIFVEFTVTNGWSLDYEASIHDGDFAETFRRLQHTCIKDFNLNIRDSPFLRYWKAQEAAVFTVVDIDFSLTDFTHYNVLDSTVNHLRPRAMLFVAGKSSWHENGYKSEDLKLLARDSFLNNLQTIRLAVLDGAFPPPSAMLKEPGYPNYELRCHAYRPRLVALIAEGIDDLIESFVRNGCANKKLDSVSIGGFDDDAQPSPLPKLLNKPTKADVPLPYNDLTAWLTGCYTHRVSRCETHSFVNAKQCKRMEVYKWTVEYVNGSGYHTSHMLQCRLENL